MLRFLIYTVLIFTAGYLWGRLSNSHAARPYPPVASAGITLTAADAINSDNPNGLPPTATAQEVADHIETWCNENEKA